MGGAPPHKNNLIMTAALSVSKLVPLKMNNKALRRSAFTCSLTGNPEAGRAGPMPYHQAESIQHSGKVITTRNDQLNSFSAPTKKLRLSIARGLLRDVMQQRRKPSEISRKHKGNTWDGKKDLRPA